MTKIMFVCFGNICRSTMAEFVMKDLVAKAGLSNEIIVESAGTHPSVGTPMHYGTQSQLRLHNIPFTKKTSVQLTKVDYQIYDYIVGMDKSNVEDIKYICGGDPDIKVDLLLDFANEHRDVDDPYYTDDYATTYVDVTKGCTALLATIKTQINRQYTFLDGKMGGLVADTLIDTITDKIIDTVADCIGD